MGLCPVLTFDYQDYKEVIFLLIFRNGVDIVVADMQSHSKMDHGARIPYVAIIISCGEQKELQSHKSKIQPNRFTEISKLKLSI